MLVEPPDRQRTSSPLRHGNSCLHNQFGRTCAEGVPPLLLLETLRLARHEDHPATPPLQEMTGRGGNGLVDRHPAPPTGVTERRVLIRKKSTFGTETLSAVVATSLALPDAHRPSCSGLLAIGSRLSSEVFVSPRSTAPVGAVNPALVRERLLGVSRAPLESPDCPSQTCS